MFLETLDDILKNVGNPHYLDDSFSEEDFEFNGFDLFRNYKAEFPGSRAKNFTDIGDDYTGFVKNNLDRYNQTEKTDQIIKNNEDYFTLKNIHQNVFFMEKGKIVFSSQTIKDEVGENITHTFFKGNSVVEFQYYFMEIMKTLPSSPDEFFPSEEEVKRRRQQEPWVKKRSFFKTNFGYDEKNNYFLPGVDSEKIFFEISINAPRLDEDELHKPTKYVDVELQKSFAAFGGVRTVDLNFNMPVSTYKELVDTVKDGELSLNALKYFAGDQEVRAFNDYGSYGYFGLKDSFDRQNLSDVINSIQERTKMISDLYNDPRFIKTAEKLFKKLDARNYDETFEESFQKNKGAVTILNFYLRHGQPFNTSDELKNNFFSAMDAYLNCRFQLVRDCGWDFAKSMRLGEQYRKECEFPILYSLRGELLSETRYKQS